MFQYSQRHRLKYKINFPENRHAVQLVYVDSCEQILHRYFLLKLYGQLSEIIWNDTLIGITFCDFCRYKFANFPCLDALWR